jgi:hypothetical protein
MVAHILARTSTGTNSLFLIVKSKALKANASTVGLHVTFPMNFQLVLTVLKMLKTPGNADAAGSG